jgi:hypothetical protein
VAVFVKDELYSGRYVNRIQNAKIQFKNARLLNQETIVNYVRSDIEDQSLSKMTINILKAIKRKLSKKL